MKPKQLILPAIIFLAIVLVALAVRLWPRTVPFDQCSDLYKQYANVEGIDATFIFKKDKVVMWKYRNCGYIHVGEEAPAVCPVCKHAQSFFEVRATNW